MLSYSFSLFWFFTFNKIPKTVIIQSPPLLVAFTSMFLLRSKKRKLILNVSDLWPIAGFDLGALKKGFSYRLLERIERFNYKKADMILGQSEEILTHITSIFPKKETFLYRNYPDFEAPEIKHHKQEGKLKLVYAGLLGIAQGVYKLCQELDFNNIEFHIYGSGAEQKDIEAFIESNPKLPLYFHGRLTRKELHQVLLQYDIAIIPLLNRIYGSVPSKIFEYAKLGLPMIYFGGGEGETIIDENQLGWVAKAGNYTHLNYIISEIVNTEISIGFKERIKEIAIKEYDFNTQLDKLQKLL